MTPRTHLVTGVSGQDGIHLARMLISRGDTVIGTCSRPVGAHVRELLAGVELVELDLRAPAGLIDLLERARPDAVHHLAAVSSVALSWRDPRLTDQVNHLAVLRLLEALEAHARRHGIWPRLMFASSSEIYGAGDGERPIDEGHEHRPVSPYAQSKSMAHQAVTEAHRAGRPATAMVLFPHTSRWQPRTFALRGLAQQIAEVGDRARKRIELFDPSARRDWGAARDHMDGWLLASTGLVQEPEVHIGTGRLSRLGDVASDALRLLGLDADVIATGGADRPQDQPGATTRARPLRNLGWSPSTTIEAEVAEIAASDLQHRPGR